MITNEGIATLVEQHIRGTEIFLVEVSVKAGNAIRVHVDRPEGISVDECAQISRYLNEQLDRDVEDYSLEVSSPGVGTPFRVTQQFVKNMGRMIEILLTGGTRISGMLQVVSEEGIMLRIHGRDKEIKFEEIKTAKAIITFN